MQIFYREVRTVSKAEYYKSGKKNGAKATRIVVNLLEVFIEYKYLFLLDKSQWKKIIFITAKQPALSYGI